MERNNLDLVNEKFDFERFFFGDEYDAALMVITPIQEVSLYTFSHDVAAKKIYESLYDEEMDDDYFGMLFNDMGAITIQLMRDGFNIIMIPKLDFQYALNSYQYERLLKFYEKMILVNNRRDDKIELHTNVFDGDRHLELGDALVFLKDMVCDVQTDERIIDNKIR